MQNNSQKEELYVKMSGIEREYWKNGYVVGVDEVGRGSLAGPLTVCAYAFKPNTKILGVNDSKKLTPKKREELFEILIKNAADYTVVEKEPQFIDEVNIYEATKIAMKEAVEKLTILPKIVLVDAMELDIQFAQMKIIKGDTLSISIAAASIIAKVLRDRKMIEYEQKYRGYAFDKHKGYCTRAHEEAIKKLGLCEIHRRSFCRKFINE